MKPRTWWFFFLHIQQYFLIFKGQNTWICVFLLPKGIISQSFAYYNDRVKAQTEWVVRSDDFYDLKVFYDLTNTLA